MLTFYPGKANKNQLSAMNEAVNEACFSIMQLSSCVNHDSHMKCSECYYKFPCRDFMRLKLHIDEVVENLV